MIAGWVGLAAAVTALLVWAPQFSAVRSVVWPGEAPLNVHDDRARDPHLRHLARILGTKSADEVHRAVAELTEQLLQSGSVTLYEGTEAARRRLGPEVAAFLAEPPTADHEAFLHGLSQALERIERL